MGKFCLNQTGYRTLVDTGSSFTYIPRERYDLVVAEVVTLSLIFGTNFLLSSLVVAIIDFFFSFLFSFTNKLTPQSSPKKDLTAVFGLSKTTTGIVQVHRNFCAFASFSV